MDEIEREIDLLESYLNCRVTSVSMHRPSAKTLDCNYIIKNGSVVNSYGDIFFRQFKYVSDSRRNWKEDIYYIVQSGKYNKLHILTHPIWYGEKESSACLVLRDFCKSKVFQCYDSLSENIRDLSEIINMGDLEKG